MDKLPAALRARLEKFCKASGLAPKEVIGRAVEDYLDVYCPADKKRIGIRDVAKACRCSVMTVHYALHHDKGFVRDETRKVVRQAAKWMGYTPNLLARGMRSARTRKEAGDTTKQKKVS